MCHCIFLHHLNQVFHMKRSHFLSIIFLLFLSLGARAQEFFEVNWKSDGVSYTGLLIYYSDEDALMRVRYTYNNEYKVAEFKCKYKKLNLSGREGFILDGENGKIVYGNTNTSYSSDNFYFYKEGTGYGLPYTIDDAHLAKDNPSQYLLRVTKWEKVTTDKFTESFVYNYFNRDEPLYKKLLGYNNQMGNVSGTNYRISAVTYGGQRWMVCMSKGMGITKQSTFRDAVFPGDWIKKKWEEGLEVTNLSYGEGQWLAVASAGTKITTQAYNVNEIFPADWVKEKWDAGYRISSIAYGNSKWAVVMSKGLPITMQSYNKLSAFPADWIKTKWDDKYRITGAAYGGGEWIVVMSQNTGITMQTYNNTDDYPTDWIKTKWDAGYEITEAAHDGRQWFITMAQGTTITQQTYNTTATYPKEWVQQKWDGTPAVVNNGNNGNPAPNPNNGNPGNGNNGNGAPVAASGTIHLIVVANTLISDIGASCQVDQERIVNEFEIFAREVDMKISKTIVNGSRFNKASVDAALNSLNPATNDVVVFAYTGHGFRWDDQSNKYPSIALKYSAYERLTTANSYLLADIYNKIIAKGARLNIVLGDCCNSPIGVSARGGDFALSSRSGNNSNSSKLRQLFLQKKGNLLIAAASPGETSCGNSRDGGYLISSFFQAISKETSYLNDATPDWKNIVSNSISSARYRTQNLNGCTPQNGIYYTTVK